MKAIEQYLVAEDPNNYNWRFGDNFIEVLIDFILYLRESSEWQKLEIEYVLSGGRIVIENDDDFDESYWELRP
ncbi:hypothetical protein [Allocoleopsis sp.]|uniref:hypothetical protein n=1 Tax=Allocoleopsis sp. TaxID=3088169 RepID=UPI002FD37C75